jgi:hypothetical protein
MTVTDPIGSIDDPSAGWAIPDSFPPTQMPAVDVCDSPELVRARTSTG